MGKYMCFLLFCCLSIASSCVQKTTKRDVTFTVNAKGLSDVNNISVRGQTYPLDWRSNYELTDEDNDSIYIGTVTFDIPYDYTEFKFVKNEDEYELKDKDNRKIYFEEKTKMDYTATFDVSD